MAKKVLMFDTCALLNLQKIAFNEPFKVSWMTLYEIENLKEGKDSNSDIKIKAKRMSRMLMDNRDKYEVYPLQDDATIRLLGLDIKKQDSSIIATAWAHRHEVVLVTDDISMWNLATNLKEPVECVTTNNLHILTDIEFYKGYRSLCFTNTQMARFYENPKDNHYGCKENEYVCIYNRKHELQDVRIWRDGEFRDTVNIPVKSDALGIVKARNLQQRLAFDLLRRPEITIKVITGRYGSGKDYIMIAHALKAIEKGKFQKIVWVRNNVAVKDAKEIGYLPGSANDKLLPYAMPIADQLGGMEPLLQMIDDGVIELQPLAFIRGRSFNNAIIYCSEAENLTTAQVKLIIARAGENTQCWFNGDYKQSDSAVFANDSGLIKAVEKLAGDPHFGYVKLEECERSETARIADMLDE